MLVLVFIDFMEEREYLERLGRMKNRLVSTFPFLHESNAQKSHLLIPSSRRLNKTSRELQNAALRILHRFSMLSMCQVVFT